MFFLPKKHRFFEKQHVMFKVHFFDKRFRKAS